MQGEPSESHSKSQSNSSGSNAQSRASVNSQRLSQMIESLQNEENENRLYATYTRPSVTSRTTTATNANVNTNTNPTIGNNFPHLPPPTDLELSGPRIGTYDVNKNNNANSQTSKSSSPALTTASLNFGAPPTIWKTATQSSQRFNDNLSSAISNYSGIVDEGIEVSYVVKNPKDSNIDYFLRNADSHYGDQQSQLEETSNGNGNGNVLDGNSANTTSKLGTPTTGSSFISTNIPQANEDLQISKISNAVKVGHHPTRMSSLNRASNLHLEERTPSMNNNNNSSNYSNITSPQTSNPTSNNHDTASQPPQRTNVATNVNVSDTRTAYSSPGLVLLGDDSEVNHLRTSSIGSGHMASESGSSSASKFNVYPQVPTAGTSAGSDSGSQVPLLLPSDSNGTQNWGHSDTTQNHKGESGQAWRHQREYGVTEKLVESADGISVVSSVVQPLQTLTDSSKNDISPVRTELKDVSPIIPRRSSARLRNKANANRVSAPAVPMIPLGVIPDTQPAYQPNATTAEGSAPQMKVEQNGLHIHQPVRIRNVESGGDLSERRRKAKSSTPSSESYYDQVLESEQSASNVGLNTNYGTSDQNVGTGTTNVSVESKREEGGESHDNDDNRYLVRPLPEVPYDNVCQARMTEGQASGNRVPSSKERVQSTDANTSSKSSTPRGKTASTTTRSKGSPRKSKKHVHSIDIDTLNQLLNVTKGTLIGSEFTNLGMQFEERKLLEKLVDSLSRLTADMILDPDRYEEGLRRLERATKALDGF